MSSNKFEEGKIRLEKLAQEHNLDSHVFTSVIHKMGWAAIGVGKNRKKDGRFVVAVRNDPDIGAVKGRIILEYIASQPQLMNAILTYAIDFNQHKPHGKALMIIDKIPKALRSIWTRNIILQAAKNL